MKYIYIILLSLIFNQVHFTDIPDNTGVNHLVVIENVIGLEPGDEIGLFDTNGLTNSGDCSSEYGELLVGAGIYTGEQLNIVGVGSVDFCDFTGGYQLAGWVEDNLITIKVWDASQDYEYEVSPAFENDNSLWGDNFGFSVVSELDGYIYGCTDSEALNYNPLATYNDDSCIYTVVQDLLLDGVILNSVSLYNDPLNSNIDEIFGDTDIILVTNDQGGYYIPGNGFNSIGQWETGKGYQVLVGGFNDVNVSIEGYPIDATNTSVTLLPFLLNNVAYLLDAPTSIESVFEDLPIVFAADDQGHYYIPGSGVNTIDSSGGMQPGKGYKILISGIEAIDFVYGEASDEGLGRNLSLVGASENYNVTRTGISHPIIIDELSGLISDGDELVAYADGVPVGVTTINTDDTNLLVAWKSLYEYGIDTDGYYDGDQIELRLFSQELGEELMVTYSFNADSYGELPVTVGSIHVHNQSAVPVEFGLEQNYPNPFNPSTTIDVSVASDTQITLNIYDINGRLVSTLADGVYDTGYHSFVWNGLDQTGNKVSAGIYFYSLQAEGMSITKKMMLMK